MTQPGLSGVGCERVLGDNMRAVFFSSSSSWDPGWVPGQQGTLRGGGQQKRGSVFRQRLLWASVPSLRGLSQAPAWLVCPWAPG